MIAGFLLLKRDFSLLKRDFCVVKRESSMDRLLSMGFSRRILIDCCKVFCFACWLEEMMRWALLPMTDWLEGYVPLITLGMEG